MWDDVRWCEMQTVDTLNSLNIGEHSVNFLWNHHRMAEWDGHDGHDGHGQPNAQVQCNKCGDGEVLGTNRCKSTLSVLSRHDAKVDRIWWIWWRRRQKRRRLQCTAGWNYWNYHVSFCLLNLGRNQVNRVFWSYNWAAHWIRLLDHQHWLMLVHLIHWCATVQPCQINPRTINYEVLDANSK